MRVRFVHTADWQLGKPFARVEALPKRTLLQQERFRVVERIAEVARAQGAQFVVVAGDLFDSPTPARNTVSAACAAIGQLRLPVLAIPGNHDHGGPGSVWEQPFFLRERESLAPNLQILLKPDPIETEYAWVFPCPLSRRAESTDTTAWLRSLGEGPWSSSAKPRIALAHGSTQEFATRQDEDGESSATNMVNLSRLPSGLLDYIALGDWHGTYQISPMAWFSGTPELDRFRKGQDHEPGNVLLVEAARSQVPIVTPIRTARFGWAELAFDFTQDSAVGLFRERLEGILGGRVDQDLVRVELTGALGVEGARQLEEVLESLQARLLRLDLENQVTIAPTVEEVHTLTQRPDPVTAQVASQLLTLAAGANEQAAIAQLALRELYAACRQA
jgi:DNA repair exonuclease SbcCD nuclease subunit